ncbi:zinc metalloprotease HtpX [Mesorhizobium sp. M5C.F.Cr.IN.023.01.1.1]|uniref:zinc metalloprotease HtpX n=1 Tax=Mesorhizobium sp. M5C.F.Cr.IN.023.01.1.1 TaxID=2496768 RepID=UPI0019D0F064|nr:zinc metalloprotease HtpX [Mesorhizobium sp. M5C.F.Cr.IN.023.01.1.1]
MGQRRKQTPGHRVYLLDSEALRQQRALNRLHSVTILIGLMALAAWTGYVISGSDGIVFGLILSGITLLVGSASGGALFRQAYGAIVLDRHSDPELVMLIAELARRAGLPRAPTLHLLPSPVLQAMAAGDREDPAIAVTSGLLQTLPPRELAAVLAHEIAHIRHGDIFIMRLAATAGAMTQVMSSVGLFLLFALLPVLWATGEFLSPFGILLLTFSPTVSDLLQLSLSRRREFLADAGAVELTGDPQALALALRRIEAIQGDDWERFDSRGARWLHWFRTHPSTSERIARLAELVSPVRPDLPLANRTAYLDSLAGRGDRSWRQNLMRPFV